MKYAIFLTDDVDDDGNPTLGTPAFHYVVEDLGRSGFASGHDNSVTAFVVDSQDKIPALRKALPGQEVVEMNPNSFKLWSMSFGEFNPDDGIDGWYELASKP